MAVIALAGSTGAPGVTTTALGLLLTWPLASVDRRVILVEASPDGGRIAAGFLEGQLGGRWSLHNLAASIWQDTIRETFAQQLIDIGMKERGQRLVLPGLRGPAQALAMEPVWDPLATLCSSLDLSGTDVVIDLGRRGAFGSSAALALSADVIVFVVRRRLASLDDAAARIEVLRPMLVEAGNADALRLMVVGDGPYDKNDIARQMGVPLLADELPYAPKHAVPLSDGPAKGVDLNSPLMRSYRTAAHRAVEIIAERRARLLYPGPNAGSGGYR